MSSCARVRAEPVGFGLRGGGSAGYEPCSCRQMGPEIRLPWNKERRPKATTLISSASPHSPQLTLTKTIFSSLTLQTAGLLSVATLAEVLFCFVLKFHKSEDGVLKDGGSVVNNNFIPPWRTTGLIYFTNHITLYKSDVKVINMFIRPTYSPVIFMLKCMKQLWFREKVVVVYIVTS